jgi:urea carboxylase
MFRKVLIANRGEIACRIARTLKKMGIAPIAVYSEADAHSLHVDAAHEAVPIGPAAPAQSYLDVTRILEAAKATGAQAIHPGYGFLSENAAFAQACADAGIVFIGPTPDQMKAFGLKHVARNLAKAEGVPLLPGTGLLENAQAARDAAERIGYPVMLKATGGGGGIGMRLCHDGAALLDAWDTVDRLARSNFKQAGIYLEKFVSAARHIEVQIFGDGKGKVIALGDRDCSVQRRNQKVIEETPAPGLDAATRQAMHEAAVSLCAAVDYASAGTVEFVYDNEARKFYFLEVNTRLQVEHGVTEMVTGVDLVEWMVKQAAGTLPDLDTLQPSARGASMQVRVYAEDPKKDFLPSAGTLTEARFPAGVRCDTWVERGSAVTPFYDPLLAKVIVKGSDRPSALAALRAALEETSLSGIETNLEYLRAIAADPAFARGGVTTAFLSGFSYQPATVEVVSPGTQTTVQDHPGRIGYWDVGVPPSGPMDAYSFRLGNRVLGNAEDAAALELTASGPVLRFNRACVIALAGAEMPATLEQGGSSAKISIPYWTPFEAPAGSTLRIGAVTGAGLRGYLCFKGGLDVPAYMGSRSTFTLGGFGGHAGRALRAGDVLHLQRGDDTASLKGTAPAPEALLPVLTHRWELSVLYGPHGAPDFFLPEDIDMFFSTAWEVHFHSNRTGVRLLGPKPKWARSDGGEAGLHPSNIHDNAYAIGAVDFTGDMPILLGPDGPSLGGFVCPATVISSELWKLGQLRPGDTVRFKRVSQAEAGLLATAQEEGLRVLSVLPPRNTQVTQGSALPAEDAVLHRIPETPGRFAVCYRQSGDANLLIEYGPIVLDLNLRFRVHALMERVRAAEVPGILDLTPGIRSLQVHFDARKVSAREMLGRLLALEAALPAVEEIEVPTRIIRLPLSWDDEAIHRVIEKYMQVVRADAPWCPSNIEFIRRINGLASIEEVKRTVFDASYLVMGLGDVYLGAPVATPLDPRHRLVTTKYNPARTWTVENVVGIGGAYMCVYGMEGPGGYQLFGRTVQMWNTYKETADFQPGTPWLLRFFDQIRFYPVSHRELTEFRADFIRGKARLEVEEKTFSLRDYNKFLSDNAESIAAFRDVQRKAFVEERERWKAQGQEGEGAASASLDAAPSAEAHGGFAVESPMAGNVWKILVKPGDEVTPQSPLLILESMKMEFPVPAPRAGKVKAVVCKEGSTVHGGQALVILESDD